jgi:hypothetical protein
MASKEGSVVLLFLLVPQSQVLKAESNPTFKVHGYIEERNNASIAWSDQVLCRPISFDPSLSTHRGQVS